MGQCCHKPRTEEHRSGVCLVGARILLGLTAVLLVLMPISENFCTFDHFLKGGQDFELTLFATLAMLCLVLLLAQTFRKQVESLLMARKREMVGRQYWLLSAFTVLRVRQSCLHGLNGSRFPGLSSIALQI